MMSVLTPDGGDGFMCVYKCQNLNSVLTTTTITTSSTSSTTAAISVSFNLRVFP